MKSVLVALDFVEGEGGELYPLELNTNAAYDITFKSYPITKDNFEEVVSDYFNHAELHTFMQSNSLSKLHIIESTGTPSKLFFEPFCSFYNYEIEYTEVQWDSMVIPDIEEDDTTLLIRIAYDTYSILDDLYARDNYEFFNLIQNEPFSLPTYFDTIDGGLDSITELEEYEDSRFPNYIKKSRLPGYDIYDYPKLYKVESEEDLNELKEGINNQNYLQKYCINSSSLYQTEGRISFYRNMSLIVSPSFEVVDLISYQKINNISIDNERLKYDSYFNFESNELSLLPESTFVPYVKTFHSSNYHFDENDYVLGDDGSLIDFDDITTETKLKTIYFPGWNDLTVGMDNVNNFTFTSSLVSDIQESEGGMGALFINLTASNEEYGEFSWYDGVDTPYFLRKSGSSEISFEYSRGGAMEEGDEMFIYNKNENEFVPFQITNIYFDVKVLSTYKVSLSPSPLFFVEINNEQNPIGSSSLFLLQHNACSPFCAPGNTFGLTCLNTTCQDCSKASLNCLLCGGPTVQFCNAI